MEKQFWKIYCQWKLENKLEMLFSKGSIEMMKTPMIIYRAAYNPGKGDKSYFVKRIPCSIYKDFRWKQIFSQANTHHRLL